MATLYLEINALQSPISIGNDQSARAMLSFNVLCMHASAPGPFEEEICKLIQNAGLAILGTDMFYGSLAQIPQNSPGPFTTVSATGGLSPLQTHNNNIFSRPSAMIQVRAASYVIARNKANAIHAVLNGKHNVTVTL